MLVKVSEFAEKAGISRNYAYVLIRPGGKLSGATVKVDGQLFIDTDKLPDDAADQPEPAPAPEPAVSTSDDELRHQEATISALEEKIRNLETRQEEYRQEIEYLRQQLSNMIQLSGMQARQLLTMHDTSLDNNNQAEPTETPREATEGPHEAVKINYPDEAVKAPDEATDAPQPEVQTNNEKPTWKFWKRRKK